MRSFSQLVRNLYLQYTPNVESFGLDEAWLDLTQPDMTLEQGRIIAEELRRRIKEEIGLTVSIGVSWNKIFAKLGSDYQKPDAVTLITPENYRSLVWPLPASDLLYVGPATSKKLARYGITTIGGIANTRPALTACLAEKMGAVSAHLCQRTGQISRATCRFRRPHPEHWQQHNSAT